MRRGIDITYPLLGEVSNLYPQEYAQGRAMLASLNARLDVTLPDGEATALAMHLVNAGLRHRRPVLYVHDDGRDPATA